MSTPTKILSDEHQVILAIINATIKKCNGITENSEIDTQFFADVIDFIQNYADKFHHAKEEDVLFVELCKPETSGQMHCNPVNQMLHEHKIGRQYVEGMIIALEKSDNQQLVENTLGYCELLQSHIYKEDNILYPMADQALTVEKQNTMVEVFNQIEKEKFPAQFINRYVKFAENISR
jgi:hemerythrin-like domain-containing protein